MVTIKVVCCSPEKIRDKLCYKGGGSIKSIELKSPAKPKEPEKKPDKPKEAEKPKEDQQKPAERKEADKKPAKPKDGETKPDIPREVAAQQKAAAPAPLPPMTYAVGYTCSEGYYNGYGGGPSYYGGPPQQPFPCYETYGRPVYDSWGGGGGGYYRYGGRTGECFSEENPQGCSIM